MDDVLLPMPGNLRYSVQRDGQSIVFRMVKANEYAAIEWVDRFAKELRDPANGALTLATKMSPDRVSLLTDLDTLPPRVVPPDRKFWRGVWVGFKRAFLWPVSSGHAFFFTLLTAVISTALVFDIAMIEHIRNNIP